MLRKFTYGCDQMRRWTSWRPSAMPSRSAKRNGARWRKKSTRRRFSSSRGPTSSSRYCICTICLFVGHWVVRLLPLLIPSVSSSLLLPSIMSLRFLPPPLLHSCASFLCLRLLPLFIPFPAPSFLHSRSSFPCLHLLPFRISSLLVPLVCSSSCRLPSFFPVFSPCYPLSPHSPPICCPHNEYPPTPPYRHTAQSSQTLTQPFLSLSFFFLPLSFCSFRPNSRA